MRRSYSDASIVIVILFVVTDVGPTEICKDKVQQHLQEPFECELDECIQNQRKKLQIIWLIWWKFKDADNKVETLSITLFVSNIEVTSLASIVEPGLPLI